MVSGSLLSHFSMPVNSGAGLLFLRGPAMAVALVAIAAASMAAAVTVLSRESMSESLVSEESGNPGTGLTVVLQAGRECGRHRVVFRARCTDGHAAAWHGCIGMPGRIWLVSARLPMCNVLCLEAG